MEIQTIKPKLKTHTDLVKKIFSKRYHSVFLGILGPNQSGKTVLALYFMIKCQQLGLYHHFGANIPDLNLGFEYDFIEDLQTLKARCTMLGASGTKRYLYLADEMGDWAPKDQAWLNVKFIRELQKVRKWGLSMIGCGIDRIDSRVLSPAYFMGVIQKNNKKNPDKAIYKDWSNYPVVKRYRIYDLPNTQVPGFDTYYPATFSMEPQTDLMRVPLSPDHKIVEQYLKTKSWQKLGIATQTGKRAVLKVLQYHFDNCLSHLVDPTEPEANNGMTKAS